MPSSLKTPALSAAGLLILLIVWQIGTQLLAERMPLANMLAPVPTFQSLVFSLRLMILLLKGSPSK